MDREKVIKDLEFCVNGHFKVELSLATKVLALLKEQENEIENLKEIIKKADYTLEIIKDKLNDLNI